MFNFKNSYGLLIMVSLNILLLFLYNHIIFTDYFYITTLSNRYDYDKIISLISFNRKIEWTTYVLFPLVYILKIISLASIVFIGIKLFEIAISFRDCIKIIIIAECIPVVIAIFKILYFYIYPPNSIHEFQYSNPFGLSFFFKKDAIPQYLMYPLLQLNLFEVVYWCTLAYGIKLLGTISYRKAFQITASGYGVGMTIWILFIVFLQLQFS